MDAEERERIRAEEFRRQLLDFQDRQVARSTQMQLAEEHSPLAWIAPILAFILVAMIWYLLHAILTAREQVINRDVFNVVLGALVTAFTTVVAYYFGSSLGSSRKDDALHSGRLTTNPSLTNLGVAIRATMSRRRRPLRHLPRRTKPRALLLAVRNPPRFRPASMASSGKKRLGSCANSYAIWVFPRLRPPAFLAISGGNAGDLSNFRSRIQ